MKKLFLVVAMAVFLSGCFLLPPPGGGDGPGAQTDWCNSTQGTMMANYAAMGTGLQNVVVEGVKTIEGKSMCSIKMDFVDPEDPSTTGSMRVYYTENEEDYVMEVYDETGSLRLEMKMLGGESTFIIYDEEGNPMNMGEVPDGI